MLSTAETETDNVTDDTVVSTENQSTKKRNLHSIVQQTEQKHQ